MKVSVIIPVYNNTQIIHQCVAALLAIDYSQLEIIFVDDGSTDGTLNILQKYAQEHPKVQVQTQEHRGPAAARNLGIAHAHGEILCFTDSDCVVPRDWISRLIAHFITSDSAQIGAVGGALTNCTQCNIYAELNHRRRISIYGTQRKIVPALPTCNLSVCRVVLEAVDNFDESFGFASGEDYDLCYRIGDLGYKILYDPTIRVRHHHPQTLESTLWKSFIHGREWIKLCRKHPCKSTKPALSLYRQIISTPASKLRDTLALLTLAGLYSLGTLCGNAMGVWQYRFPKPGGVS